MDDELDVLTDLAVALRASERHGGEGRVVVTSLQGAGPAALVEVCGGRSRCTKPRRADAQVKAAIAQLRVAAKGHRSAEMQAADAAVKAVEAAQRQKLAGNPLGELRARAVEVLRRADPETVRKAIRTTNLGVPKGKKNNVSLDQLSGCQVETGLCIRSPVAFPKQPGDKCVRSDHDCHCIVGDNGNGYCTRFCANDGVCPGGMSCALTSADGKDLKRAV
jgi:hypothetical protein